MKNIDILLVPKESKIIFMGKEFITSQDVMVIGSVKGLDTKKEYYYHELKVHDTTL